MSESSHSHSPYMSPPLRSALKNRDSNSRPNSPAIATTLLPTSPSLRDGTTPLPGSSPSPGPLIATPSPTPGTTNGNTNVAGGYTPKVSFDTFENPAASMFSFTLSVKTEGYARNMNTRVFLVAASHDESGHQALDWALDSLVQDSDEVVVFRGIDSDDLERKDHNVLREEARDLLHQVEQKSFEYDPDRKISVVVEFIAGKVTDTIDRLIALYRPDSVVVGTSGQRSMIQTWGAAFGAPGMGSVSKYCLSHSPVPVIVVRPERKVKKAMEKRRANPKRGIHFDNMLTRTKSHAVGSIPL